MKISMMRIILFLSVVLITAGASGQEKSVKKADKYFTNRSFNQAIVEYKSALSNLKSERTPYVQLQIAKAYHSLFDFRNAVEWYGKLRTEEMPVDALKDYGFALLSLSEYDRARDQFTKYCEKSGRMNELPAYEKLCTWPLSEDAKVKAPFTLLRTDLPIAGRGYGYSYTNDGVMFSTPQASDDKEPVVYYDLAFSSFRDSVSFNSPQKPGKNMSRAFYEGTPSLTSDGMTMYYTSNLNEEKKVSKKSGSSAMNVLQLFVSSKVNGEWSQGIRLEFSDPIYNYASPFISGDGKTLYFASDMNGGAGRMDLYKVVKTGDNTWNTPENLGVNVNTSEDEVYPYISSDHFYFSSRGREGFGGLDVYKAMITGDGEIGKPVNAGMPVNSSADDFAFILKNDGRSGLLTSNRDDHSTDVVYGVFAKALTDTLRGIVTDTAGLRLSGVTARLYRLDESGEEVLEKTYVTTGDGSWIFVVDPEKKYRVELEMPSYKKQDYAIATREERKESGFSSLINTKLEMVPATAESTVNAKETVTQNNIAFYVQIGAYRFPQNFNYKHVESLGTVVKNKSDDGVTRFTFGAINSMKEAQDLCSRAIAKGIKDAFVYAMKDGRIIYAEKFREENILAP